MVAVLEHHLTHVVDRLFLPVLVADVLPTRDLGEDQKPQLVAGVDEILALRIVRGAHGVAAKLFFQDARVLPLQALRRGIAHVRIRLMAVEPAHKRVLAVEVKSVLLEHGGAEAEARFHHVHGLHIRVVQRRFECVEVRFFARPRKRVRRAHGRGPYEQVFGRFYDRIGIRVGVLGDALARGVQDTLTHHGGAAGNGRLDPCGMKVRRLHEHVCGADRVAHIEPHVAIQPAVGQVIDDVAERRDLGILGRIEPHGDEVRAVEPHGVRDLHAKRGVAGAVRRQLLAVYKHRRDMCRAVELQKETFSAKRFVERKRFAIAVDALVILRSRVMLRDRTGIVRKPDRLSLAFAEAEAVRPHRGKFPAVTEFFHPSGPSNTLILYCTMNRHAKQGETMKKAGVSARFRNLFYSSP